MKRHAIRWILVVGLGILGGAGCASDGVYTRGTVTVGTDPYYDGYRYPYYGYRYPYYRYPYYGYRYRYPYYGHGRYDHSRYRYDHPRYGYRRQHYGYPRGRSHARPGYHQGRRYWR